MFHLAGVIALPTLPCPLRKFHCSSRADGIGGILTKCTLGPRVHTWTRKQTVPYHILWDSDRDRDKGSDRDRDAACQCLSQVRHRKLELKAPQPQLRHLSQDGKGEGGGH